MKKILLIFFIFNILCSCIFSFDMNSIKNHLGKEISSNKSIYPDMKVSQDTYSNWFFEDGNEYLLRCFLINNKITGVECTLFVNSQNEAIELFNKLKRENTMPSGGKLLVDTANDYMWTFSKSILVLIRIMYENGKYGVTLRFH